MGCLRFGHKVRFYRAQHRTDRTTTLQHAAPPSTPAPASDVDATPVDVALQPVLVEQTELLRAELRNYITRVGSVCKCRGCSRQLQVVPVVSLLPKIHDGSADGEAGMYGDLVGNMP